MNLSTSFKKVETFTEKFRPYLTPFKTTNKRI